MSTSIHNQEIVILAANDLGMHCMQKDYSAFLLLPPANNLRVQVFRKKTRTADLINSGITVQYEMVNNTTSADKVNFWEYAKDYGYDVKENIGITGNGLSGVMKLSADGKYYEATAIPVTPYTDTEKNLLQPYQIAKITVLDNKTNQALAVADSVVVPVSDELKCSVCHGERNTGLNILQSHDELSGTSLVKDLKNNIRHKCADCHKDNAIGAAGKPDVKPLSEAMHGFHKTKVTMSTIEPICYSCHPGPVTQCYRGTMLAAGISCADAKCHGDMANVANTQKSGREAWLEEPDCGNCHGARYATNSGTLYNDSYLLNAPSPIMNNKVRCQSCHNSAHAEWPSTLELDNALPQSLLGYASYINQCTVCHRGSGTVAMHQKE